MIFDDGAKDFVVEVVAKLSELSQAKRTECFMLARSVQSDAAAFSELPEIKPALTDMLIENLYREEEVRNEDRRLDD